MALAHRPLSNPLDRDEFEPAGLGWAEESGRAACTQMIKILAKKNMGRLETETTA